VEKTQLFINGSGENNRNELANGMLKSHAQVTLEQLIVKTFIVTHCYILLH